MLIVAPVPPNINGCHLLLRAALCCFQLKCVSSVTKKQSQLRCFAKTNKALWTSVKDVCFLFWSMLIYIRLWLQLLRAPCWIICIPLRHLWMHKLTVSWQSLKSYFVCWIQSLTSNNCSHMNLFWGFTPYRQYSKKHIHSYHEQ